MEKFSVMSRESSKGNTHTNENVKPKCNCKSLLIKASHKCKYQSSSAILKDI